MNNLNEELKDTIMTLLKRTNEDFGLTLSGNPFSREIIEHMQKQITETHMAKI